MTGCYDGESKIADGLWLMRDLRVRIDIEALFGYFLLLNKGMFCKFKVTLNFSFGFSQKIDTKSNILIIIF